MTTLRDLNACRMESRIGSTIQKEWDKSPRNAFWLVTKAHSQGKMLRRELLRITLLLIDDVIKLAPKESQDCISELWKCVNGDDSIDLEKVRKRAFHAADAAAYAADADAAYYAASAAYAADDDDAAADAAYYAADAYARATYDTAARATYDTADAYKKIYSIISCEDVCKYFTNMDKDKEIV